ncbi:MAG: PilZ domain-containing protein [Nitrospiraceae bacterium]
MIPTFVCPSCRAASLVYTSAKTLSESILGLLRIRPFRCQECGYRCLKFARRRRRQVEGAERRKHLRIPVRLYLSFSGGRIRGEGHVVDLSLGGCMIKSDAHVKVDDIFYLEIVLPDQSAPVEVAAIVRSVGVRGIAFQFLRKSLDNKRLLTFIQSQTGKPATAPEQKPPCADAA